MPDSRRSRRAVRTESAADAAFRTFVEANGATLLHAARLLTGDYQRGEDLVQTVLMRLYLKWNRVDAPLAYARRALVSAHIDSTRRRWWGERPTEQVPDAAAPNDTGPDDRDELRRRLAALPARERATVVLRYYCDLSEAETARTLAVPVGTVKSNCARALARLRVQPAPTR